MKKSHKRLIAGMLAACLLFACASAAVKTIDVSKQSFPSSFKTEAKALREKFKKGEIILPLSPASAIKKSLLADKTLNELDALEESFFPINTDWFDPDQQRDLHGTLSTAKLSAANKKAVDLIRAERKAVTAAMPAAKSGAKIDLNGDGKTEQINIAFQEGEYGFGSSTVKIGGASTKIDEGSYGFTDLRVVPIDAKKKALLVEFMYDNDYRSVKVLMYDGKNIKMFKDQLPPFRDMRYQGNGVFLGDDETMPTGRILTYKLTASKLSKTGARKQAAMMFVWPSKDEYATYNVKCPSLDGGSVTFKAGEPLTVLHAKFISKPSEDPEYLLEEAMIAIMNKEGKVGLLQSDGYGYTILGSDDVPFLEAFRGFYFHP